MDAQPDPMSRLVELAEDQLRWQKAAVLPQVRQTIDAALTSTKRRQAYEMCDGTRRGAEIAAAMNVTRQAFSKWAGPWRDLGIVYETPDRRLKHLASLDSLGLDIEIDEK